MGFSSLNKTVALLVLLLATFTTLSLGHGNRGGGGGTQVGFYSSTCPRVESIVRSAVESAVQANPTIAPGLLRMFFHDCFINGCDASILIDGPTTEKSAGPNSLLRGFEVIDAAKSQLETTCPGVVSCADIVALAARDSVVLTGGRGHTIGTAACSLFSYRLYNFNNTNGPDPDINPAFLPLLRALCPNGGDGSRRVALDTSSENSFGSSFYENLRNGRGVIESDAKLWSDQRTQRYVQGFLGQSGSRFNAEFGRAMVNMGNIEVKTGRQGEIRRVCTATN
ncbi:putative peroxidase [Helianthus annuus]|nr:putative peroxidase [Helianthus annuus]